MASACGARRPAASRERPAIDGDVLYLPLAEGRLAALDLKTGTLHWSGEVGPSPTEPLVYANRVYLGSDWKRFQCLDAATGERLWNWKIGTRIIGPAAADDGAHLLHRDGQSAACAQPRQRRAALDSFRSPTGPTRGPVVLGPQVAVPGHHATSCRRSTSSTGKPTGKLTLPVQLAIGPSFVPPDGADGVPAVVAITGGLTNQWTLSLAVPAPDTPAAASPSGVATVRRAGAGRALLPHRVAPAGARLRESDLPSARRTTAGCTSAPLAVDEERLAGDVDDAVLRSRAGSARRRRGRAAAWPRGKIRRAAPASGGPMPNASPQRRDHDVALPLVVRAQQRQLRDPARRAARPR